MPSGDSRNFEWINSVENEVALLLQLKSFKVSVVNACKDWSKVCMKDVSNIWSIIESLLVYGVSKMNLEKFNMLSKVRSMEPHKSPIKTPEIMVFARFFVVGFLGSEIWRAAYYLGENFSSTVSDVNFHLKVGVISVWLFLFLVYAFKRGAHLVTVQIGSSLRIDLLLAVCTGIWANELASPWLLTAHNALRSADPAWAPVAFLLMSTVLFSPLFQQCLPRSKRAAAQLYFVVDEEIRDNKNDLLKINEQAKSFADVVLASGDHSGLVFGVDGPWGVGKTSFLNLAERYWSAAQEKVIVCRFEPLRYASEPDLADRMIRDLSAAIQKKVFAPEFRPAVNRYSRLIKGRADFSFLGFKLSLLPSQETVDELLDDIDEVLRRIGRRVIIVVDDLDRLDAKTTNNVLFATRRTFRLSQATYILCYDTEVLVGGKEDGERAREFLEKFVTVKMSLFVDSSSIANFLRRDWQLAESQQSLIPSEAMIKLGSVLNELADILEGDSAAKYLPLMGDLRKVKRFVNAMLLMQLEKSNLGRTDFNKRDLINLMLLHLNFPGLFRRIYAEETEGRGGVFSVHRDYKEEAFKNSSEFSTVVSDCSLSEEFLLRQLFDVETLGLGNADNLEEGFLRSRACFNHGEFRNLEGYLKLIVRFVTPEPQETFVLYREAVERIRSGVKINSILASSDFTLDRGEYAHDQFWRVLVNQSHQLTSDVAQNAIEALVTYLPRYSAIDGGDSGLRQRSIYSLLRLLDKAGWGRTSGRRLPNSSENIIEIAWRIFGENSHKGNSLLDRLASKERGVLGWNDVMIFRLQCSADRQGQLHNLHSALILDQDRSAATTGLLSNLALMGMRRISQEVFSRFKRDYIDKRRNFMAEVDGAPIEDFLGEALSASYRSANINDKADVDLSSWELRVSASRSAVKAFVIYQLSNSFPPNGSGVGCGYYDECGADDHGGIAKKMNEYMFDVCFNPEVDRDNVTRFLDYCLSNLSSSFFAGRDEEGYFPSKKEISGGLDQKRLGRFWSRYQDVFREYASVNEDREVVTFNYVASYKQYLSSVFAVLDELAEEVN